MLNSNAEINSPVWKFNVLTLSQNMEAELANIYIQYFFCILTFWAI